MLVEALERRPWWRRNEEPTTDSDLWWGGNGQPFDWTNGTAKLINKMSVHSEICVKHKLATNLRRYARAAKIDVSTLVPVSFVLVAGSANAQIAEITAFRDAAASSAARGAKIWIVKPGSGNRGHGIKLCSNARAVEAHLAHIHSLAQYASLTCQASCKLPEA